MDGLRWLGRQLARYLGWSTGTSFERLRWSYLWGRPSWPPTFERLKALMHDLWTAYLIVSLACWSFAVPFVYVLKLCQGACGSIVGTVAISVAVWGIRWR